MVLCILAVFQTAWHWLATKQWSGYLALFATELKEHKGFVDFEDTLLREQCIDRQSIGNMNWGWTTPAMSIVLSEHGNVQTLISIPRNGGWQPFDPLRVDELPDLSPYGISYSQYLEILPGN